VGFDDVLTMPRPQTGPLVFGGEKRIPDLIQQIDRNPLPASSISTRYASRLVGMPMPSVRRRAWPCMALMKSVEERLMQHGAHPHDLPAAVLDRPFRWYSPFLESGPQKGQGLFDHVIHPTRAELRAAGARDKLMKIGDDCRSSGWLLHR